MTWLAVKQLIEIFFKNLILNLKILSMKWRVLENWPFPGPWARLWCSGSSWGIQRLSGSSDRNQTLGGRRKAEYILGGAVIANNAVTAKCWSESLQINLLIQKSCYKCPKMCLEISISWSLFRLYSLHCIVCNSLRGIISL